MAATLLLAKDLHSPSCSPETKLVRPLRLKNPLVVVTPTTLRNTINTNTAQHRRQTRHTETDVRLSPARDLAMRFMARKRA